MVEVYVTAEEAQNLQMDRDAQISYADIVFTWTILSVSSAADKTTLYKVVVWFDHILNQLWDVASVSLPIRVSDMVLPLNVIIPLSPNQWFVWILHNNELKKQTVTLGHIWGSSVEILSGLVSGMSVVTNDVSYFDPLKFTIKQK